VATQQLVGPGTYGPLSQQLGPVSVPTAVVSFELAIDTSSMTDASSHVFLSVEVSQDGGTTWDSLCSFDRDGGAADAAAFPVAKVKSGLPGAGNASRKLRATLILTGAAITTSGVTLTTA
jgi:hypothetical protein